MSAKGVIFAGGGTGGHIYPSIAIAEHLQHHQPGMHISVICSTRSIDQRVLDGSGLDFDTVPAQPFGVSPKVLVRFAATWPGVVRACRRAMRACFDEWSIRADECVLVAMGGFVSPPAVWAARSLGVRRVLVNLDAVPGRANRFLAPRVDRVFSTYAFAGATRVGPIVRSAARVAASAAECRTRLGLDPAMRTLLITGASQGARSINEFVLGLCAQHPEMFEGWQILHQAGEDQHEEVEGRYRALSVSARVVGLVDEVGLMWGACDAALSRAGAGSVAEVWINRIPTIFMPYPYHRDAHQKHNVQPLVDSEGAILIEDLIDADANVRAHGAIVGRLLSDDALRQGLRQQLAQAGARDGADEIAIALQNL